MKIDEEYCNEIIGECDNILQTIAPELSFYDAAMRQMEEKGKRPNANDKNYAKLLSILGWAVAALKDNNRMLLGEELIKGDEGDSDGEAPKGDGAGESVEEGEGQGTGESSEGAEGGSEGDGADANS